MPLNPMLAENALRELTVASPAGPLPLVVNEPHWASMVTQAVVNLARSANPTHDDIVKAVAHLRTRINGAEVPLVGRDIRWIDRIATTLGALIERLPAPESAQDFAAAVYEAAHHVSTEDLLDAAITRQNHITAMIAARDAKVMAQVIAGRIDGD